VAVSIKDVAKVANVSYSTVSRALNDSPRVRAETRARIQHIAQQMGYLPSAVGRSLVTRRTHTLGVVVSTIADLFFAEVVCAVEETALAHGYGVILCSSGADADRERRALRALRERRVDGIVLLSSCCYPTDGEAVGWLDVPLVIVNNVRTGHAGPSVEVDNLGGSAAATRHLLRLGHRRIAHIAGPPSDWDSGARQAGYEQALGEWGVALDPELLAAGDSHPQGGIDAMQRLLSLPERPTALFCYNDATALGAVRAACDAGLRVPHDLSVVGFDDIDLAPFMEPPLTTVAQPKREMGEAAVHMVLDLLAGRPAVPECVLPARLIVRSSTRETGDRIVQDSQE
jgi:DNA-binding LacI/PurR family transcriptional regulator